MAIHRSNKILLELQVNELTNSVQCRTADTLLHVLRNELGLTGAKPGCLNGDCGACTLLMDGVPMKSCLLLAVEAENQTIMTIEGLKNSPLQTAFIKHWAFQCGYCTPGFIMNAHALRSNRPDASDEEITDWLQSNLCRCTGYREIEEAVKAELTTRS